MSAGRLAAVGHPLNRSKLAWLRDGSGSRFRDVTGKGYDADTAGAITWVAGGLNVDNFTFANTQYAASKVGPRVSKHAMSGAGTVLIPKQNYGSGCYFMLGNDSGGFGVGHGGNSWDQGGVGLVGLSGNIAWLVANYTVPTGRPVRIGFSYDGADGRLYVDGNLVYTQSVSMNDVDGVVTVGAAYTSVNAPWRYLSIDGGAVISDVSIWSDRVLRPQEFVVDNNFAKSNYPIGPDSPLAYVGSDRKESK